MDTGTEGAEVADPRLVVSKEVRQCREIKSLRDGASNAQ